MISSSGEDTDDSNAELTDSCVRVAEVVGRSSQVVVTEPKIPLAVRPRGGTKYLDVRWLPDLGVFCVLITEGEYKKLLRG